MFVNMAVIIVTQITIHTWANRLLLCLLLVDVLAITFTHVCLKMLEVAMVLLSRQKNVISIYKDNRNVIVI